MTDPIWPDSPLASNTPADGFTYNSTGLSAAKFSIEKMNRSIKEMEWLNYEVAPEWRRFCSFGPEDIGSVWETIGAIRKRPRFSTAVISQEMAQKLNEHFEREILYGNADSRYLFGVRVEVSPLLSAGRGFLMGNLKGV